MGFHPRAFLPPGDDGAFMSFVHFIILIVTSVFVDMLPLYFMTACECDCSQHTRNFRHREGFSQVVSSKPTWATSLERLFLRETKYL